MRRFDCNYPRLEPRETLQKVRARNIQLRFSSYFLSVIQRLDAPVNLCPFNMLTRLAKLFSLLGHTASVIMFIDMTLSLSHCFDLSARRNSFRFKPDQISFY